MADIPTELAKTGLERLMNAAIEESRYMCCFTCIAEDFEKEKETLKAKKKTVEQRVQVAKNKGEDIRSDVTHWQDNADKLIQEDHDTKTKKTYFFGLCPDFKWRYSKGKDLANKTGEIKGLVLESGNFESSVGLPSHLPGVEYHSSQYYIPFKSRESKYKELLDALKDDNNYITGLQGMGGTGKTILAKQVGKELKVSKQFDQVIDTTVSFTPDIKKIQDDIAGPLGLSLKDYVESDRPKKLWSRLTNGEKILVILDDVWNPINFDKIGIPSSDNHKGCRVLVTTRNLSVCNSMRCERIIQLEVLSKEDARNMFKRYAGIGDNSSKSLIDKGCKIADECKGLPVAIAVIGSSLKGKQGLEEWDVALKSLQKPVSMHGVDENSVEIYKCLKFSYDYMKDEKVKGLFLLCSLFREDEEISIEMLTRLGIGVGLFGEVNDKYDEARSQVVVAKNKLIDSCLLLKGDEGTVKMHDLVREVALWIANKEIQAVNMSNQSQKSLVENEKEKNIKYLLCEGKAIDVFSWKFDVSKLEILILYIDYDQYTIEVPNSFFENMTGLQVLLLENNVPWRRGCLSLPLSIQSLINIRSLILCNIELGDISILGKLQSLETLELLFCNFIELPPETADLKKFRLLKLECCEIMVNDPFEVIDKCTSLEELYIIYFTSFINLDKVAIHKRRIPPALQGYHLSEKFPDNPIIESTRKCVECSEIEAFFSEETFKYLVQTANVLKLDVVTGEWRCLIPEIVSIDKGMNDLLELNLYKFSQLECLIDTRHVNSHEQNVFTKLVSITLLNMGNLEELCKGLPPFDFLKSLESIDINDYPHLTGILFQSKLNLCNIKTIVLQNCPMLVSLFRLSTSRSLVLLEKLEIYWCEQLKCIIMDKFGDEIIDCDNDNKCGKTMFPNLRTLEIKSCSQLEFALPFLSAQDVPLLEQMTIEKCDKLKYIFGQYRHEHEDKDLHQKVLGSLKEMELSDLPNFIDIFPAECDHPIIIKRSSPKVQMQSDPITCNIFPWKYTHKLRMRSAKIPLASKDQSQDNPISLTSTSSPLHLWERAQCLSKQSHILCNIRRIKLHNLSKIKSVFILSIVPTMLLETLTVENCDGLKHIIVDIGDYHYGNNSEGIVFPNLKELWVKGCGQLEYIFGHYTTHDHQYHNEIHLHFPALKCLMLHNLQNLIAMCPKNYRTTLPPLTELKLNECSKFTIKSIGDFIFQLRECSLNSATTKDLSENVKHFLTLEYLEVYNSKAENVFCLNEIVEEMNLGLQIIQLGYLPQMTYLFMGTKKSFSLQNLTKITIVRCEKLELIFPASISRYLPLLRVIIIVECKALKYIIEEDAENGKMLNSYSPKTTFPELELLNVINCNKLKYVFPISTCKELPKLRNLMIQEAHELEEVFGCGGDQKIEIPNLKFVAFVELPSLCQVQGFQFQFVTGRLVHNCPKLSMTSSIIIGFFDYYTYFRNIENELGYELTPDMKSLYMRAIQNSEVQAASGHELSSSQELQNEQSTDQQCLMNQQHPLGETDANTSQENNCLKETEDQSIQKGSTLEKTTIATSSTDSKTRKDTEISAEEGTTSANVKTIISPTNLESGSSPSKPLVTSEHKTYSQEDGGGQITIPSFPTEPQYAIKDVDIRDSLETTKVNDTVSLKGDTSMKVSSIIEEQFSIDDDTRVLVSKPSPISSQPPSVPSKALGDTSKIMEDLSIATLITRELEQLVFNKHLSYENLSLLTEFLIKHPSVRLTENSLSNRYKGYAYSCLAELLKFLQSHSVLDVLGSSHSEFVELLQDVRRFAFDKDWLDSVERRALFPRLQASQDALPKLLDSKQILSQQVKDLKHQLASFEDVLESIIQEETQVLEARDALSAPLGY